jgi:hypothetical protein
MDSEFLIGFGFAWHLDWIGSGLVCSKRFIWIGLFKEIVIFGLVCSKRLGKVN